MIRGCSVDVLMIFWGVPLMFWGVSMMFRGVFRRCSGDVTECFGDIQEAVGVPAMFRLCSVMIQYYRCSGISGIYRDVMVMFR